MDKKNITLKDEFIDTKGIKHGDKLLSDILGQKYHGGELIAFGICRNDKTNYSQVAKDEVFSFADTRINTKVSDITNYVDGVLKYEAGTLSIYTKGIVGFVEAQIYISGEGKDGLLGFWWRGNANTLPNGVTILPINGQNYLSTGPIGASYGGSSNTYFYKIDDSVDDVQFFVNPSLSPYGGAFTPCNGGVKSYLLVKVYARKMM